ncbi:MAG: RnfABCDGE type electron transport complex subunit D [Bacteroidales bacterium]|nr:RnfABCDGE type electron transport complex subunit D [Bacteroidales bacterium]MBQ8855812.1 RnfABCDGE type electron transport complex subunit D [Bacteroidales bacterium]MBQ9723342.1 RnfABCDGE type electron transport complex subunit D [Bacteroidales bacterium]
MEKLLVSPSPHLHTKTSTKSLMRDVVIAMIPAVIVSILFYGWSELLVLGVSVASCVLLEFLITKYLLKKTCTICDMSAVVTGILLALNLPSTTPWWVVFIGAVFAIGVAKMTFGGLGQNLFNPAIAGRVFLLISFPTYMTDWTRPQGFVGGGLDALSGATPLGLAKEGGVAAIEGLDYMDMLFYNIGGSAGELSAIAILIGFVYLLVRKVIRPYITLSILATVAIFSGIFWGINPEQFTDPVFNLLTGGLLLGSVFMATDYVTSPMSNLGGIIYGVGIGVITMLIRYFGAYPEGVSFAILIMNSVVPLINKVCHAKKYGR